MPPEATALLPKPPSEAYSAQKPTAHWRQGKKNVYLHIFINQPNESVNMPPKVSVILPNYNYARYLKARIDSILNQTFQDFELILLDDCSTDNSAQVLEGYRKHPLVAHLVVNTQNTGSPFAQWFRGIGLAQGEYIWIAESDDLAEPTFLETTAALLDRYPQAAVCYTGSTQIDENGTPLPYDMDKWKPWQRGRHAAFGGRDYIEHNFYWRNYIGNASAALFRKSCFERAGVEQCLAMRYSGDWLFWFRMALTGDVVEVYRKLNYFRQHTQKVTVKAENNGGGKLEDIEIVCQMEQALPRLGRYKRTVRHGLLYNRIGKLPATADVRRALHRTLKERLKAGKADGLVQKANHLLRLVCPWAVTMKRDRLVPRPQDCR